MARIRPARGWHIETQTVQLTKTNVDNVRTQAGLLVQGDTLDFVPLQGEARSEWLMRRILVWFDLEWTAGQTDNDVQFRHVEWALMVVNDRLATELSTGTFTTGTALNALSQPFWSVESNRFLQGGVVGANPMHAAINRTYEPRSAFMIDHSLNANLTEDANLVLAFSQGDSLWDSAWLNGETVTIPMVSRVLFQKGRGR